MWLAQLRSIYGSGRDNPEKGMVNFYQLTGVSYKLGFQNQIGVCQADKDMELETPGSYRGLTLGQ